MSEFECSERKASYLMSELDTKSGIGLIEKKRQGLGKPNLIYTDILKELPCTKRLFLFIGGKCRG